MSPTEVIDAEVVKNEVVAYLGNVFDLARNLALAVKDDASANQAAELGTAVKARILWLRNKRKEVYEPLYQATERVRNEYDDPIKMGTALEKTLGAAIIKYQQAKKREEDRLRMEAEAEARRQREEADRKAREAEAERQRIIREQEERERKRREEEAAEQRRVAAEKKAREDAERAQLQREQDERAARMKKEEDDRIAAAQQAQTVGLPERVDAILETPRPIAPIANLPSKAELDAEAARKFSEKQAQDAAESKRQQQAAEEQRLREEEQARMKKLKEDADRAAAEASQAEANAAAQATVTQAEERMRTSVTARYEIADRESFLKLTKAVSEGRAPIDWLGFDCEHPEKFRAPAIGRHATKIKNLPDFAAKQAEAAAVGVRIWLEEGGTFKAEKGVA